MRSASPLLLAGLLIGLAWAHFGAIRDVWSLDPDAAAYLSLGRNVAAGAGYVLEPVPTPDALPHSKYPPGWPLLLAGLIGVSGPQAYGVFHGALVSLGLVCVLLAYRLARRLGYPPAVALAVAAATGLSQTFFELSVRYLRTEVPFTALSLGALLALLVALAPGGKWRHVALASLLVVAATATRLAGVTLLVVPAAYLLRPADGGGRRRAATVLLIGALAVTAWIGRSALIAAGHPQAPDYGAELAAAEPRDLTKTVRLDLPRLDGAGLLRRVGGNLDVLARASAVLLTNVDKAGARLPVGVLTLLVFAAGWLAVVRGRSSVPDDATPRASDERRIVALFVGATLVLYLLWPFNQQQRFYAPLLPMLLLAAGEGLLRLRAGLAWAAERRAARLVVVAAGLGLLVLLAAQRSDDPSVLGRWSRAYAALLAGGALALAALTACLQRQRVPRLPAAAALLLPLIFAGPWARTCFGEWPEHVAAWERLRAETPRDGPLARIDVHPLLEEIAVRLAGLTPPGTIVMTDVPKMLAIIAERPCVPFTYRVDPPTVVTGPARVVFSTRELPEAAAVMDACADRFDILVELDPIDLGAGRLVRPTVYAVR